MKKIALIMLLLFIACVSFAYAGVGLTLRPTAYAAFGINDYFRGGGGGAQLMFKLLFLHPGLEVFAEYDIGFSVATMPVNIVLGLGRDIWFLFGQTFPLGVPSLGDIEYKFSSFPNTFGLGVALSFLNIRLGPGRFMPVTEATVTLTEPLSEDPLEEFAGFIGSLLLGLKVTLGVTYEIRL